MARTPFQFRLRSLFVLAAVTAVLSEGVRSLTAHNGSPFLLGFVAFLFGGTAAFLTYGGIATMSVLAARSPSAHRMGSIAAAVLSTMVWLSIVILLTFFWIPICVVYSALVVILMVFFTRRELAVEDTIAPEHTLQRLREVKAAISAQTAPAATANHQPTSNDHQTGAELPSPREP